MNPHKTSQTSISTQKQLFICCEREFAQREKFHKLWTLEHFNFYGKLIEWKDECDDFDADDGHYLWGPFGTPLDSRKTAARNEIDGGALETRKQRAKNNSLTWASSRLSQTSTHSRL